VTELHLRGPALLITVGPAASGKSTLLGRLHGLGVVDVVVSTDAIRAALGLADTETERTYAEARRRVRLGLEAGLVVASDATNLRPADRAAWRAIADTARSGLAAIRLGDDLTVDDLVARDAGRARHVPAAAIREHLAQLRTDATPEVLRGEGLAFVAAGDRVTRCASGCGRHGAPTAVVERELVAA
jgi:predicted kinase